MFSRKSTTATFFTPDWASIDEIDLEAFSISLSKPLEPKIIDEFNQYKGQYCEENDLPGMGEFNISEDAYKTNKKFFKSVIKLEMYTTVCLSFF